MSNIDMFLGVDNKISQLICVNCVCELKRQCFYLYFLTWTTILDGLTCIDNVKEDLEKNADIEAAMELIRDRQKWRHFIVSSADGREQRRRLSFWQLSVRVVLLLLLLLQGV